MEIVNENKKKCLNNFFPLFTQNFEVKKKFKVEKKCFDNTVCRLTLLKRIIKKKSHYNFFKGTMESLQNKKKDVIDVAIKVVATTDCSTETCFQRETEPLLFFQKNFDTIWHGFSQCGQCCDTFPAPGALYTHDGRVQDASVILIPMDDCGQSLHEWKRKSIDESKGSTVWYRKVLVSILNKLEKMNGLGILHGSVCDNSLVMKVGGNPDDWFLIDVGSATLVNNTIAARLLRKEKSYQRIKKYFNWIKTMTDQDIKHFDVIYFLISEYKYFDQSKYRSRKGYRRAKNVVKVFIRKALELISRRKKEIVVNLEKFSSDKIDFIKIKELVNN